jgi:hypothetical protein
MTPSERETLPNLPASLHPRLLALTARVSALLGSILVAEGTAAGCHNDVGVAQILEERWQSQGIYFARNDGRSLRHALPFLVVIRSIRLVLLQHERDVLVRSIILHLTEAHGANMDAAGSNDARNLGVDESCVTALSLRACDSTMSSTVVVQELFCEVAARNCDSCTSSDIAINQECAILT